MKQVKRYWLELDSALEEIDYAYRYLPNDLRGHAWELLQDYGPVDKQSTNPKLLDAILNFYVDNRAAIKRAARERDQKLADERSAVEQEQKRIAEEKERAEMQSRLARMDLLERVIYVSDKALEQGLVQEQFVEQFRQFFSVRTLLLLGAVFGGGFIVSAGFGPVGLAIYTGVLTGLGIAASIEDLLAVRQLLLRIEAAESTEELDQEIRPLADLFGKLAADGVITPLLRAAAKSGGRTGSKYEPDPDAASGAKVGSGPFHGLRKKAQTDESAPPQVARGNLPAGTKIPKGFRNAEENVKFIDDLRSGLSDADLADVQPVFQGGAVTGGTQLKDFDVALVSEGLFNRTGSMAGARMKTIPDRIGPLTGAQLRELGLTDVQSRLTRRAGRPVNFMVYPTTEQAFRRPSIWIPEVR